MTSGTNDIEGDTDKALEKIETQFNLADPNSNIFTMLGCHAEYTCSERLLEGLVALSYKHKSPIYTHASETLLEVGECTVRHKGLTPPMYLHSLGFFDHGATLAHGVHLDKEDIALLSQCGVCVVTNPSSNLKLGSGIAPITALNKSGVCVALGTDGAASNNSLDMFKEMYLVSALQKMAMSDASALPAETALKMATEHGAQALGLKNLGTLKTGNFADIIRIDATAPEMHPSPANINHIVFSANKSLVKLTMCSGKILYENGNFCNGLDIDFVTKNAQKSSNRLVKLAKLR